jgi:DNA modification methylase
VHLRLLADARIASQELARRGLVFDALITDPPYDAGHCNLPTAFARPGKTKLVAPFRLLPPEECASVICQYSHLIKKGGDIYVFANWKILPSLRKGLEREFSVKSLIVWDKMLPGLGHYWRNQLEFIIHAIRRPGYRGPQANRETFYPGNMIRFRPKRRSPFVKPWQVYYALLRPTIKSGMQVLDVFAGSCPLAIAADMLGAKACLIDIDFAWTNACPPVATADRLSRLQQLTLKDHGGTGPV